MSSFTNYAANGQSTVNKEIADINELRNKVNEPTWKRSRGEYIFMIFLNVIAMGVGVYLLLFFQPEPLYDLVNWLGDDSLFWGLYRIAIGAVLLLIFGCFIRLLKRQRLSFYFSRQEDKLIGLLKQIQNCEKKWQDYSASANMETSEFDIPIKKGKNISDVLWGVNDAIDVSENMDERRAIIPVYFIASIATGAIVSLLLVNISATSKYEWVVGIGRFIVLIFGAFVGPIALYFYTYSRHSDFFLVMLTLFAGVIGSLCGVAISWAFSLFIAIFPFLVGVGAVILVIYGLWRWFGGNRNNS